MSKRKFDSNRDLDYGVCPRKLTLCPNCNIVGKKIDKTIIFSWAINLQCHKCSKQWTICTQCKNARKRITNKENLRSHHKNCHVKTQSIQSSTFIEYNLSHNITIDNDIKPSKIEFDNIPTSIEALEQKLKLQSVTDVSFDHVLSETNNIFFNNVHKGSRLSSILINALSQHQHNDSENTTTSSHDIISPIDISLHTSFCNLAYRLSYSNSI